MHIEPCISLWGGRETVIVDKVRESLRMVGKVRPAEVARFLGHTGEASEILSKDLPKALSYLLPRRMLQPRCQFFVLKIPAAMTTRVVHSPEG